MKHKLAGMIASVCLVGAISPAMADNIAFNINATAQSWNVAGVHPLALTAAGLLVRNFVNPAAGPVTVSYTAECSLTAAPSSWLSISIYIDNILVAPSSTDVSFCAGNNAGGGLWASQAITVAKILPAGAHTVRIDAEVIGAFTFARIDDTTLVIER